ncbi:hypothetical protein KY290_016689 [Solanum tuberosum]|uniref:Uncharacterized protein n=1 Tax=Solanum tuberosum TaxID=4113 RepID=A0ABQ7V988_SOLTU|nr:hypothetical protein KY284_015971 [Solanum tuberosum]KAH0760616.1 hypothetical protein KY290_016689 [Solanum tuberosum]
MMHLMQFFQNMQGVGQGGSTSDVNANLVQYAGASEHMSFHPKFFTKLTALSSPLYINLPNSFRVKDPSVKTPLVLGEAKDGMISVGGPGLIF